MHSSRMRTGRSLTVCQSLLGGGVSAHGGVCWGRCLLPGGLLAGCLLWGVSAPGGVSSLGVCGIRTCTEADTPPGGQNHRRL